MDTSVLVANTRAMLAYCERCLSGEQESPMELNIGEAEQEQRDSR